MAKEKLTYKSNAALWVHKNDIDLSKKTLWLKKIWQNYSFAEGYSTLGAYHKLPANNFPSFHLLINSFSTTNCWPAG